ncbi:MAG TPA: hypothetical protein VL588_00975, partial [Bdellovibrionota bacterium]|nr:hypothetical protein [Bdellovibrionota bacterium]
MLRQLLLLPTVLLALPAQAYSPGDSGMPGPDQTPAFEIKGFPQTVSSLSAGYPDCGILEDGTLACAQAMNRQAIEISQLRVFKGPWIFLDSGTRHSCGIAKGNLLRCWGNNDWGQLGSNHLTAIKNQLPFKATWVSAGEFSTCAVSMDGKVLCWGKDERFQLGLEKRPTSGPCKKMWCSNKPQTVALGKAPAEQVSLGKAHACALDTEGQVWCWGENTFGELGSEKGAPCPKEAGLALRCEPKAQKVEGLPGPAVQVTVGGHFTCALTREGQIWCWGVNFLGQLGANTTQLCVEAAAREATAACSPKPVQVTDLGGRAARVQAGEGHACALIDTGEVRCWGGNAYGELGDGTLSSRFIPAPVKGIEGKAIALTVQLKHGCAVTDAHRV